MLRSISRTGVLAALILRVFANAANASPADVASLQRILREAPSNFAALKGEVLTNVFYESGVRHYRGAVSPLALHCEVWEDTVTYNHAASIFYDYDCASGGENTHGEIADIHSTKEAWARYGEILAAWRAAAPDLEWTKSIDALDEPNSHEIIFEGRYRGPIDPDKPIGDPPVEVYLVKFPSEGNAFNVSFRVQADAIVAHQAAVNRASAEPPPAGAETRLVCEPTSGSVRIDFSLDIPGKRVIGGEPEIFFPNGARLTVSDREIKWAVGDQKADMLLDRYTLELNETTTLEFAPLIHLAVCKIVDTQHRRL